MSDTEDQAEDGKQYRVPKAEEYTEHYATRSSVAVNDAGDSILIDFQHDDVSPVLNESGKYTSLAGQRTSVARIILPPSGIQELASWLQDIQAQLDREVMKSPTEQAEKEREP